MQFTQNLSKLKNKILYNDIMTETDFLICPICASPLRRAGNSFLCTSSETKKKHCFDISSARYADLSYRNGGSGDPKDAVTDRTAFLDKGYYAPLSQQINSICEEFLHDGFLLVDAGCGEAIIPSASQPHFPSRLYSVQIFQSMRFTERAFGEI